MVCGIIYDIHVRYIIINRITKDDLFGSPRRHSIHIHPMVDGKMLTWGTTEGAGRGAIGIRKAAAQSGLPPRFLTPFTPVLLASIQYLYTDLSDPKIYM
jgi:hypothetical protein